MKKTLVAISVAAFLGTAGAALAEEAKGKIQSVDPAAKTITLEDGTTYTLAEGVTVDTLQPGTDHALDRVRGHACSITTKEAKTPSLWGGS